MKLITKLIATGVSLSFAATLVAQSIGQWDFENGTLASTSGSALTYADATTQSATEFGSTTSFGIPSINGTNALVMKFSANTNGMGFLMPAPASGNGSGSQVNEWTLIFDVLYPAASNSKERPIIDIDNSVVSENPEFVVTSANGLGVPGGLSFGTLSPTNWYRVAVVTTADAVSFYINGQLVGTTGSGGLDGRFALSAGGMALLLGTPGTNAAPGYVNSIQLRDAALSAGQVFALGGPSAAGIPQIIPPIPSYIVRWTPPAAVANRSTPVGAVINIGDTTIANSSISLKLDTSLLADLQISTQGNTITVLKSNLPTFAVNSTHTLELTYTDSLAGQKTFTHTFKAVLLYEDFEELTLGTTIEEAAGTPNVWTPTPPAGWVTNHTGMPGYGDPDNDGMVEWAGWTFAKKDFWVQAAGDQNRSFYTRGQGTVAIADPDEWDDATHPKLDDAGNALYFNSFLSTPAIDISGIPANTINIKFDSSWRYEGFDDWGDTNNQTATLTVAYDNAEPITVLHWDSKEGGPFLHQDNENEPVFIQLTNPPNASKMVVTFGLTQAANDWWWAFDNLEINAGIIAPSIAVQPINELSSPGGSVTFVVQGSGTEPLAYKWQFNGADITGANSNQLTLVNVQTNNAGLYTAVVSNGAGSATGSASLKVFTGSVTQDLVVHLKFDGNYQDASGRNNNASAVNSPTFEPGFLGQAVHVNSSETDDPNNYVTLGYPNDLKFGSEATADFVDFSFAFWTKVVSRADDKPFIANKDWGSGGNRGFVLASQGGGMKWNYRDDQSARRDSPTVGAAINDGGWHNIVVTFERTNIGRIYVDGQLANTALIAPDAGKAVGKVDTDDLNLNINFGQDGTGDYTDGGSAALNAFLDDVGIWRRALTPQEAAAIYNAGLKTNDLSQAVVGAPSVAPTFTVQPTNNSVFGNDPFTLYSVASGTPPLSYQWYFGGAPIAGATNPNYTIASMQQTNVGQYFVVANNVTTISATSLVATLTYANPLPIIVTGQWDFDAGDLRATTGSALTNFDATVGTDTQFGTSTAFGIAAIGGAPAKVLYYAPSVQPWGGYIMPHGAAPNGGGARVNRFTIIYDVLYPASSNSKWRSLLQTNPGNSGDGDFFVNDGNGIGISGNYPGTVAPDVWNRIVAVFNLPTRTLKKYINGTLVGTQTLGEGTDGRWSLAPTALLFADEDGETNPGYVNSIQFRNGVMTDAEVAALGGVATDGIPGLAPSISSIVKSGNTVVISWTGSPGLRLEQNSTLSSAGWTDVPGTAGASTATVQITGDAAFFRLAR